MKITRRLKITVTQHRWTNPLDDKARVLCPACGCEIQRQAVSPDTALTDESALPPQEPGLSRDGNDSVTALVPTLQNEKEIL